MISGEYRLNIVVGSELVSFGHRLHFAPAQRAPRHRVDNVRCSGVRFPPWTEQARPVPLSAKPVSAANTSSDHSFSYRVIVSRGYILAKGVADNVVKQLLRDVIKWLNRAQFPVAAGKAANLVGERPMPSIARFGRLAYPMRGEVTNRAVLGRKRHGRPGIRSGWPAVGTTWVAANSEA